MSINWPGAARDIASRCYILDAKQQAIECLEQLMKWYDKDVLEILKTTGEEIEFGDLRIDRSRVYLDGTGLHCEEISNDFDSDGNPVVLTEITSATECKAVEAYINLFGLSGNLGADMLDWLCGRLDDLQNSN